jgi:hypothetical protein
VTGAPTSATEARSLAATLAPVLAEACGGRLGPIRWFKADWQRGGAATGISTFDTGDGGQAGVVVKLPVVPRELTWTRRLQPDDSSDATGVVPRLFASGETLGGYDLAWVIIECLPYGPLGAHWHDDHVSRIAEAAARLYQRARSFPIDRPPRHEDWDALLREAGEAVRLNDLPNRSRWTAAVRALRHQVQRLGAEWEQRGEIEWLHGDLHLANAMSRTSLEAGPVCLIDLAEVHPGHWVEEAVYLERQLWARPERLKATRPVRAIAQARRAAGLPVADNYPRLAMLRRALLAGSAPRYLQSEGDPRHLDACLDWLERALAELK